MMQKQSDKGDSKWSQSLGYFFNGIRPRIACLYNDAYVQNDNYLCLLRDRYSALQQGSGGYPAEAPPPVSVVIPIQVKESAAKFLASITSLLNSKDVPPVEIITIINGKVSTEEIEKTEIFGLCAGIGFVTIGLSYSEDDRYRNIGRPRNIFTARQAGVEKARGSIILSADIDNVFSENWIRAYSSAFSDNPDLLIAYGPVGFYGVRGFIGRLMASLSTAGKAAKILIGHPPYAGHNHAMRREVLERIPHLYSERILVHENEIPAILENSLSPEEKRGYIRCVQEAVILTDFGKQKQSVRGAVAWFLEAVLRNIRQVKRMNRMKQRER